MRQYVGRWLVHWLVGATLLAAACDTGRQSLLFTALTAWGIIGLLLVVGLRPTMAQHAIVGRSLDYPLIGLFLLGGFSTLWWTIDQGSSHLGLIKLANFVLLALLLPRLLPLPQAYRFLLVWLVLLSAIVAAWGFLQLPLGLNAMGGRLHSLFLTPNSLAGFLAATLPITGALFVTARLRSAQWGFLFLGILQAAALAATGSRGGWLAAAASFVLFSILVLSDKGRTGGRHSLMRPLAVGGVVLVLSIVVIDQTNPELIRPRLASLSHPLSAEPHRYLFWQSTIEMIKERPLMGWGIGTFGVAYPRYKSPVFEGVTQNYAHNDYLQIGAELGLLGLVCLFWLIAAAGWAAVRNWRRCQQSAGQGCASQDNPAILAGVIAGGAAILLHSLVDFDLYVPVILLVFAMYLAYLTSFMSGALKHGDSSESFGVEKGAQGDLPPRLPFLSWSTARSLLWVSGCLVIALLVGRPYFAERASLAGQQLMERSDYQEAADRFLEAIRYHPQQAVYYGNLAFAYEHWANRSRRKDLLLRAEAAFQAATLVGPHHYQHYWDLGRFYKNYVKFSTDFEHFAPLEAYQRAAILYPTKQAIRQEMESLISQELLDLSPRKHSGPVSLTERAILLPLDVVL